MEEPQGYNSPRPDGVPISAEVGVGREQCSGTGLWVLALCRQYDKAADPQDARRIQSLSVGPSYLAAGNFTRLFEGSLVC